jgi:S-adenosylmethionine-diacylgycerolhomoserine-N-methlytransferase
MDLAHQRRMDAVYGQMKYIYDATRPLFLAGRRQLRDAVRPAPGARILEVGCGTARNLILLAHAWPQTSLVGIDISSQMLSYAQTRVARAKLANQIVLIEAELSDAIANDQCRAPFDYILFSYSLSMIPDWQAVLQQALPLLRPGTGVIVIADFGACNSWPAPLASRLTKNLSYFAVTPRPDLVQFLQSQCGPLDIQERRLWGGYGQVIEARRTFVPLPTP